VAGGAERGRIPRNIPRERGKRTKWCGMVRNVCNVPVRSSRQNAAQSAVAVLSGCEFTRIGDWESAQWALSRIL
jgi:hypothetical protein